MTRGRTVLAGRLLMIGLVATLLPMALAAREADPCRAAHDGGVPLQIHLPGRVPAGDEVDIVVAAGTAGTGPLSVTLVGADGAHQASTTLVAGSATVRFGPSATRVAGSAVVVASTCESSAQASLEIEPGPAVSPVLPLVGPKMIVADGRDHSLAVFLPVDRFGNPVADGSRLEVAAGRPNGETQALHGLVRHLLAWVRVAAGTMAGTTVLAARVDDAVGPTATIIETAAAPEPGYRLTADPPAAAVDARAPRTIRVGPMADRYGNPLPDGVLVLLVATDPDGSRRVTSAPLIDASAALPLPPPSVPGRVTVVATVMGSASAPLPVDFGPTGGATVPLEASWSAPAQALQVRVGPLSGALGGYLSDGAVVLVRVSTAGGWTTTQEAIVVGGVALALFPLDPPAGGELVRIEVTTPVGVGETEVIVK